MPSFRRHTHEKLADAVSSLATGQGDARQRVGVAYESLRVIEKRSLTPSERAKLEAIMRKATRFGPLRAGYDGSILRDAAETALRTYNRTAAKIAVDIWALYWCFREQNPYSYPPYYAK